MAEEEPPTAHEVSPGVPAALSKIIRKMMAPRIRDRFQNMDKVADVLGRLSPE
jgi:molybdopterin-biosynthesis enzyme MoeA-like protein